MKQISTRVLAYNAIVAALYVALTWVNPISYGMLQFRLSTLIMPLPFFRKELCPGILIGVMLANLNSPLGPIDILCGFMIQSVSLYGFNRLFSSPYVKSVAYGIWCGIMVGLTLNYAVKAPLLPSMGYVGLSNILFAILGTFLIQNFLLKPLNRILPVSKG